MASSVDINNAVEYYKALLLYQYQNQPKAVATIDLLIRTIISELIPLDVINAFDFETAVGVQLDVLGQYIGLSRQVFVVPDLDDTQYRQMLRFKILNNYSDNTLLTITTILNEFFGTDIIIYDLKNMTISYAVKTASEDMAKLAYQLGLIPKPQGVGIVGLFKYYVNIFEFSDYNNDTYTISGFSDYLTGWTADHWLQYSDKII